MGIQIECFNPDCKNIIYVWPFEIKKISENNLKKFCSRTCSSKVTKNRKKTGEYKNCVNCDKEFYVEKHNKQKKCCSVDCANIYKTGIPLIAKKNGIVKNCIICDKEFYVQYYRVDSAKYCSNNCRTNNEKLLWKKKVYNPDSIKIIEEYGIKNNYKFQHAENGGEYKIPNTRYFVYGYDKMKNVVIEYDEKHHYYKNGQLKNKDIKRQNEIIDKINCLFIRINYKNEIKIYGKTVFTI